jgi:manganese/zinc/iron transport system permease protein
MMAVASGGLLLVAILFANRKGLISRAAHDFRVAQRIVREDILGQLYRAQSLGTQSVALEQLKQNLHVSPLRAWLAVRSLARRGFIILDRGQMALTDAGRAAAQNVVRAHRLWEHYLAAEAGLDETLLHAGAERLEHFTDRQLRERLHAESNAPATDPHGTAIPPEA